MTGQAKVQLILELKNRLNTGLSEAKKRLNGTVDGMKQKLNSLKLSHVKAFQAMKDEIPGLDNALRLMANPYVAITAALVGLTAAGMGASKWASEWDTNMRKVNVTTQLSKKELAKLDSQILAIGMNNPNDLKDAPLAYNKLVSSGMSKDNALTALDPTLKAAKAGFADLEVAAAAGAGVMNSSGESITRVYDILFATVNKGNAEFKDIAQYLPKIVPLAKAAGFALDETAGAWAYLTAKGQSPEQATTGIMNAVKAFSTKDIVKGMSGIGVNVFDAKGQTKPLLDIIDQLSAKMNKLTPEGKMNFLDAIGLKDMEAKGAIVSMTQDVWQLKDTIDGTVNSQGQLNEAVKNAKGPMDDWKILFNQIQGEIIKPFGEWINNTFGAFGTWLLNNKQQIKDWASVLGGALTGLGIAWGLLNIKMLVSTVVMGTLAIKTALVTAAQWALNLAMSANPIGLIVTAVGALIGGLVIAYQKFDKFKALVSGITQMFASMLPFLKAVGVALLNPLNPQAWGNVASEWKKMDLGKAYKDGYNGKLAELKKQKEAEQAANPMAATPPTPGGGGNGGDNGNNLGDGGISKITDSGQAPKNITINIDSFVKGGINTSNTTMQNMDARKLEEMFKDMFLRVIANVETGYQ